MPSHPREMITMAERRFPVRMRLGVPPGGFGQRHTGITALLHLRNAVIPEFALLYQRLYNIGIGYISSY